MHTPRPWTYNHRAGAIITPNGQAIMSGVHYADDGRLAAAAPDLLDACKRMLADLEKIERRQYCASVGYAKAAIEKAEPQEAK